MFKKLLILILLIFTSCSIKSKMEHNTLAQSIDNFTEIYNNYSLGELKSILIYYEENSKIHISDIPLETVGSFKKENQILGKYKDVVFEIYGRNIVLNSDFYIFSDKELNQLPKLMLEYNTQIIITYDLISNQKKLDTTYCTKCSLN